ncbi:MAG: hypothetical protein IJX24_06860 [Oscillospiraceae bacterium]|nr:hypothetical protein [Oscillospiraceae bacterium]
MSYVEQTVYAGQTVEVKRYHRYRNRAKGEPRGKKLKETSLAMEEVNRQNSENRLRWLLNTNFQGGDYHLVLRYKHKQGDPYRTADEMKTDMKKYLRNMRARYRKEEREFMFVYVFEIGERKSRHIHIVQNKIDMDMVRQCWPHGFVTCTPLDNNGDYRLLASYLIKYSDKTFRTVGALMGKRYSCSRNLKEPVIKRRIIKRSSTFRDNVKPLDGYFVDVDSIESGFDAFGYKFFKYTMVKLE